MAGWDGERTSPGVEGRTQKEGFRDSILGYETLCGIRGHYVFDVWSMLPIGGDGEVNRKPPSRVFGGSRGWSWELDVWGFFPRRFPSMVKC